MKPALLLWVSLFALPASAVEVRPDAGLPVKPVVPGGEAVPQLPASPLDQLPSLTIPSVPGAGESPLTPLQQAGAELAAPGAKPAETLDRLFLAPALYQTVAALSAEELMGRAPMSNGSRLAREYIISKFQEYGIAPMGEEGGYVQPVKSRLTGRRIGNNVVGYIKGTTHPDEFVYVDAHYDHWGMAGGKIQPGANDNASGVALLLELARVMSGRKPERSVVFMAADNEEGALLPMFGGIKGAKYHAAHPTKSGTIKAALVLDTMGGAFVPGVKPALYMLGSESSRATYDLTRELATAPGREHRVNQLGVYAIEPLGKIAPRADYGAYRGIGAPFLFATSGIPREYHSHDDTIDKVDFEFMRRTGADLLKAVERMASSSFDAKAERPDAVADWKAELAVMDRMIDEIASVEHLPYDMKPAVEKLKSDQLKTRAKLARASSESSKLKIVKKAMTRSVVRIMKMTGSLKVAEHVYRDHGVPPEPKAKAESEPSWLKRFWANPGAKVLASVAAAGLFNLGVLWHLGGQAAQEFLSTYLIEWTLSLDNLVVLATVLNALPKAIRSKVLGWGIVGTIAMRFAMVSAGIGVTAANPGIFVVFGAFLITVAVKMLKPEWDLLGWLMKKAGSAVKSLRGPDAGKASWFKNPFVWGLAAVIGYDAVFALDSVPAALAISKSVFIIVAANAFSVLGLRSLYSVLDKLEEKFRHLNKGVAAVLLFIAAKMILEPLAHIHIGSLASMLVVLGTLGASMLLSLKRR